MGVAHIGYISEQQKSVSFATSPSQAFEKV